MTQEEHVFGLLMEANPIPASEDLELDVLPGDRYLADLEQRSSEVTQTDTQPETRARTQRRQVVLGLAAVLAVVLTATILVFASSDSEDVVATTTIPGQDSQVQLQGRGTLSTRSFVLEAGSYTFETTVTGDCSYVFDLSRSGTGHRVETITSTITPGTTIVTVDDIPSGSYFVNVDTDSQISCPWSIEIASG